jgi:hypothetical protein
MLFAVVPWVHRVHQGNEGERARRVKMESLVLRDRLDLQGRMGSPVPLDSMDRRDYPEKKVLRESQEVRVIILALPPKN